MTEDDIDAVSLLLDYPAFKLTRQALKIRVRAAHYLANRHVYLLSAIYDGWGSLRGRKSSIKKRGVGR
jgi:hypothetical protein